jgi:hypothetical protein
MGVFGLRTRDASRESMTLRVSWLHLYSAGQMTKGDPQARIRVEIRRRMRFYKQNYHNRPESILRR